MSTPPIQPPHNPPLKAPAADVADPPDDSEELRADATATLKECEDAWGEFRKDAGTLLGEHVDRTFHYFENILADGSSPTDWVKDGAALWINCFRTGRGLLETTHKLYCLPKK